MGLAKRIPRAFKRIQNIKLITQRKEWGSWEKHGTNSLIFLLVDFLVRLNSIKIIETILHFTMGYSSGIGIFSSIFVYTVIKSNPSTVSQFIALYADLLLIYFLYFTLESFQILS